jgi:glycosyltransferase involved in cell wall biosynthesis
MRILMLTQFYAPMIGGTEQHVRTLSIELVARGHDVAVVTMRHKGQAKIDTDHQVRVYRIQSSVQKLPGLFSNNERQHAPPFPDPEMMLELRSIIETEKPQIVHAHNWLVRSFLPLKVWSQARLVVTLHDYNLVCAKDDFIYHDAFCTGPGITKCLGCAAQHYGVMKGMPVLLSNWVMSLVECRIVDMFVAVSQATAIGNGLVDSQLPFQVIPNFIADSIDAQPEDAEPYLAQLPAEGYLLFVGALGYAKGVDVLLHAYAGLTNAPPLVLIGYRTPDWPFQGLKLSHSVIVLYDWPNYAIMEAWKRCSIALVPSIMPETFGIVVLEAMKMAKPVIASNTGALSDIVIDAETGILVAPGNSQELREAIQHLLDEPVLRQQMGNLAMQRCFEYEARSVVPRIEHVYQEVLAK